MAEKTFKMIAIGTVRHGVLIEPASSEVDSKTGRVRIIPAVTERKEYAPGDKFEANEKDRDALIAAGAARLATKEVPDDGEQIPVSPNTAPRLPASGATDAPNPDDVAKAGNRR